jgi:hypothetical protein
VIRWLQTRKYVDGKRIAIWGDSFIAANSNERRFAVPLDTPDLPRYAEPVGAQLALLAALYEPEVKLAYGRGGVAWDPVPGRSAYLYVPHGAVVPHVADLQATTERTLFEIDVKGGAFPRLGSEDVDDWNCWNRDIGPRPATDAAEVLARVVKEK